jgi:hypothetical protein
MNLSQLLCKLSRLGHKDSQERWWVVTVIQIVTSIVAAPLAISLLSQLP